MKYLGLLFLIVLFISSCGEDEIPTTSLVITVVDENNNPLADANVDLYPSLNDWLNETSAIYDTEVSGQDGRVTYMDIDTGAYYINAYKNSLTNWEEGVVKNIVDGFQNTTDIFVVRNSSALLSNAEGKKWILEGYSTNGEDSFDFLEDCIKDDTLKFFKGPGTGAYNLHRGTLKCSEFQEDMLVGIWTLLNDDSNLQIQIGNDFVNWEINFLSSEELNVTFIQTGNVQNAFYRAVE